MKKKASLFLKDGCGGRVKWESDKKGSSQFTKPCGKKSLFGGGVKGPVREKKRGTARGSQAQIGHGAGASARPGK